MRPTFLIALITASFCYAGVAQAQIKAGIPPKSRAQIQAERLAKAERQQTRLADADAERRHDEGFARLDANRDGRISRDEYRAAGAVDEAIEDRGTGAQPREGRTPSL